MRMVQRVLHGGLSAILALIVLVAALGVAGAFLPSLPVAGAFGMVASLLGPVLFVLLLIVVAVAGVRWKRRSRIADMMLASAAVLTLAGLGVILVAQVHAARAAGVAIDLPRTLALWFVPRNHPGPSPTEDVYGRADGRDLHVLLFRPARGGGAPAPVIVYVHGGGWVKFTEHFREPDMRWFADHGYLVVSVEYGLSDDRNHRWNVAQPQVGCALAWVNRNAARLGGDASRLALFGDSAGGNLVLATAYAAATGALRPACEGALPHIAAAVAVYPVIDVAAFFRSTAGGGSSEGASDARAYLGGSPDQVPERYAFVSPGTYVSAHAPPTLLLLGQADTLVQPDAARALARRLARLRVPVRTIEMPYATHAYDVMPGGIGNQLTRQATLRFLAEHGVAPCCTQKPEKPAKL